MNSQTCHGTGSGGRVDECCDDAKIALSDGAGDINAGQQLASMISRNLRRLAFDHLIPLATHSGSRVQNKDMAVHTDIEEGSKSRKLQLLRRQTRAELIDVTADGSRLDVGESNIRDCGPFQKLTNGS